MLLRARNRYLMNSRVPVEMKEKGNDIITQWNPNLKTKGRGYGEIGRRYGLNWIEPWYGNLLSDNFQIQRNPGINKRGNPEPNPVFHKQRFRKRKKDRCRDSTEAVLTNGVGRVGREIFPSKIQKGWRINVYTYVLNTISND